MIAKKITINPKFREILEKAGENQIKRKELINLAMSTDELNLQQATRFIAKNIHELTKRGGVIASGKRNERIYSFSSKLFDTRINSQEASLEQKMPPITTDLKSSSNKDKTNNKELKLLLGEEKQTDAELKLLLGEIQAYQDYLSKIPSCRETILMLLDKAKNEAAEFYGRLSAIKKIIEANRNIERPSC